MPWDSVEPYSVMVSLSHCSNNHIMTVYYVTSLFSLSTCNYKTFYVMRNNPDVIIIYTICVWPLLKCWLRVVKCKLTLQLTSSILYIFAWYAPDGLVKKLEELEKVAESYRGLMEHAKKLLKATFDLSQSHRGKLMRKEWSPIKVYRAYKQNGLHLISPSITGVSNLGRSRVL